MKISKLKAVICAVFLLFWCLLGALTMLFAKALKLRLAETFPLLFHGTVARLFGLECEYVGSPCQERPTLFASNHVSYMDVFVLGGILPGSFVAKSEVASWPLFGKLAKLQNTLFLERRPRRAAEQIGVLEENLQAGTSLIFFPEGTSTAGDWVAPFRSSLFAAAHQRMIQPVSVVYLDYAGQPMSRAQRDHFAWYLPDPKAAPGIPNEPFAAHFFKGLGLRGRCRVKVVFHEPMRMQTGERKAMAAHCEAQVRQGLEQCLGSASAAQADTETIGDNVHGVVVSTQSAAP